MNIKYCYSIYLLTIVRFLLLLLLSISISPSFARNVDMDTVMHIGQNKLLSTVTVSGKIVDDNTGKPLVLGIISIIEPEDSRVLTRGTSNAEGAFYIETTHRNFSVRIEYLAYQTSVVENIQLTPQQDRIDLGTIGLTVDAKMIEEVEVRAERSTVVMNLDKRVFNVGKDLTSAGGTAEDVLRNVPGVSIGIDGNFNLRSSSGVRILLNGRASALVDNENLSGLRQIQANQIERIEIITNPSARYEAEGMVGIINIIMKKNQNKGSNGAIHVNLGHPDNYGIGINANYQKDKWSGFIGVGGWYVSRPGTGSFRNEFYNGNATNSTIFSNLDRTHKRNDLLGYLNFGVNYQFNAQSILQTSFSYRRSDGKNTSQLIYTDAIRQPEDIFLITQRLENETEKEADFQSSLIYKKLFNTDGHQFTADIQFEDKVQDEASRYEELYFDKMYHPLDTTDYQQFSNNEEGNRRLGVNIDYVLPFEKEGKFEAGFQSSLRDIFNNYKVREIIDNIENPNINFTNDFNYQEVIHGVYVNFGKKMGSFSIQTGLRMEHSDVETKLLVTNEINQRSYTNLFPSTFLTYDLSENNAFQLSYSRRIQRPTFADLNPFFTLRDRRNIFRGNPNIEPEYTHSFELGHIKYWEKGSLSSVAYFRKTSNVIKRLQRVDKNFPDITITQAENLALKRNYGIEFTYSYFPIDWWRLNGDINLFHSLSEGSFMHEGREIFVGGKSFSMTAKTSALFTFWEKINAQVTGSYSAPRTTTQGINRAMIAADFATGIDFLQNNGTLTLSVSDVFNSRRRRSFSEDETFYSEDDFLWQRRSVVLSFHYRFNQQKERNRIYSNPVGDEEEGEF